MRKRIHAADDRAVIAMSADVTIAAGSEENKGPRRFDVTAYTGGALRLPNYALPVVVDLKGMSKSNSLVANLDHKASQRVGHVDKVVNDTATLQLSGIASAATPYRDEVIASADGGFTWQASIEAVPSKTVEVKAGKSVDVNGQSFEGPLYVVRKSTLKGFAFVSHGADDNTTVKIAATAAGSKSKESDMEFDKWIEAQGFDPAELNDKQKAYLKAQYDAAAKAAEIKAAADKKEVEIAVPEFDADEIKAAASEHLANLEATFAEYESDVKKDKFAEIRASANKEAKELKVKALKERWLPNRYEAELIRASANVEKQLIRADRPDGPAIMSHARPEMKNDVIEAALSQTVNLPDIEKHYDDKTLQAAHTMFRGRIGLQQMLLLAAEANGCERQYSIDQGNLRTILEYAFPPKTIHASSTMSLPGILSNVANKELLQGYMEEDQTWREIAAVKTVGDFKQITSYRMLDNMQYLELGPSGEIKHGTLSEESYTRQAKTYARMYALTRTHIINDDLGAYDDLRSIIGRGGAQKFNDVFWLAFLNNSTFFTAARGNYITGSTTTLLTDGVGLELSIVAFDALKSPSTDGSKRIAGNAELLLHPPELQFAADRLYQSTNIASGTTATNGIPNTNIHANKYKPVKCRWLSDSTITNYSTTAWYLFRNPRMMPAMVASFLNGVQTPTVESADADFDQLGIQFRGYHDFGADRAEYLCGIKSKGAA